MWHQKSIKITDENNVKLSHIKAQSDSKAISKSIERLPRKIGQVKGELRGIKQRILKIIRTVPPHAWTSIDCKLLSSSCWTNWTELNWGEWWACDMIKVIFCSKSANSLELKGGPLSENGISGIPTLQKCFLKRLITGCASFLKYTLSTSNKSE